jgi:hypothetical protein
MHIATQQIIKLYSDEIDGRYAIGTTMVQERAPSHALSSCNRKKSPTEQ